MLLLVIAMGAPLFAVIGYALLSPNPQLPKELTSPEFSNCVAAPRL